MHNHYDLIKTLTPIFMMSPSDVALYCPQRVLFDYVIFDESSQIKPVYAIGSILRAKHAIIAGDINQMPPTDRLEESMTLKAIIFQMTRKKTLSPTGKVF